MALGGNIDICKSFYLKGGSSYLVCGGSGSGKSTTVVRLVESWTEATGGKEVFKDVHIWYVSRTHLPHMLISQQLQV